MNSNSQIVEASDPEQPGTPPSDHSLHQEGSLYASTTYMASPTPRSPSEQNRVQTTASSNNIPISLYYMLILRQSHEQEIVDRVVLRHSSNSNTQHSHNHPTPQEAHFSSNQPYRAWASQTRIVELESQLAQLWEQEDDEQRMAHAPEALGKYNPTRDIGEVASESASGVVESVEILFPGVERATLVQIIENRFKPTYIYHLLATVKKRAESQRVISIGGVEFEQAERDGKEGEYRMTSFFKAWAAYLGILVELAPYGLQGELATALSIYTMNLYELLEKYNWDGVRVYHFQFHRKQAASGKNIYQPVEWRTLDSELVASTCFAYPAPQVAWTQSQREASTIQRRPYELPICESIPGQAYSHSPGISSHPYRVLNQRATNH